MEWIKNLLRSIKNKVFWKIFWIKNRNAKFSDLHFSINMNSPNLQPETTGFVSHFLRHPHIVDYSKKVRDYYKSNPKFNIEFLIKDTVKKNKVNV